MSLEVVGSVQKRLDMRAVADRIELMIADLARINSETSNRIRIDGWRELAADCRAEQARQEAMMREIFRRESGSRVLPDGRETVSQEGISVVLPPGHRLVVERIGG